MRSKDRTSSIERSEIEVAISRSWSKYAVLYLTANVFSDWASSIKVQQQGRFQLRQQKATNRLTQN
jgi:hypothetical protein